MGKKIDLNSPKKNTSGFHHRKGNHLFSNTRPKNNYNTENQIGESSENESTNNVTNNQYIPKISDTVKATIKMPIKTKIVFTALLVAIPFVLLMLFVVLFSDASADSSGFGSFAYGADCQIVTVTDTDCNQYGDCNNTYSGEVEFEEYIAGVVAGTAEHIDNVEYYKTVAVSVRTYLLNNVDYSCQVEGNDTFQTYISVEESPYSIQIKQAVEETKGEVIINNESELQSDIVAWYKSDNRDTNCINEECLNKENGMTNSGVQYLISQKNYNYEQVIKYYYEDSELQSAYASGNGILVEGFINPTDTIHCTSPYGYRTIWTGYSFHNGVDIAVNSNIYATKSGKILEVVNQFPSGNSDDYYCKDNSKSCGNYIVIEHEDGYKTTYCHIKYNTIPSYVYAGAEINQGQIIGTVGSTGCSSGNHLHYAIRKDGNTIDPADYLDLTAATGTCQQ